MTIRDPICGSLVCLTPLSVVNAADWVRWMEDPETTRFLYSPGERPRSPFTPSAALDWGRRILADPNRVVFGLAEPGADRQVGDARLTASSRRRARFSIMIGEGSARNRGLGSEATQLVCEYGFRQLGLREITLEVDPQNLGAIRAYEKAGFQHHGKRHMRLKRARWEQRET